MNIIPHKYKILKSYSFTICSVIHICKQMHADGMTGIIHEYSWMDSLVGWLGRDGYERMWYRPVWPREKSINQYIHCLFIIVTFMAQALNRLTSKFINLVRIDNWQFVLTSRVQVHLPSFWNWPCFMLYLKLMGPICLAFFKTNVLVTSLTSWTRIF